MRRVSAALLWLLLLVPDTVFAQSSPNLNDGDRPSGATWRSLFAAKADALNGVLTTPTIVGGAGSFDTLTVAGTPVSTISGTVTGASVASANGFSGSVANSNSTLAFTLSTSVSGLLKGSSGALVSAVAGTDFLTPTGSGAGLTGVLPLGGGTLTGALIGTTLNFSGAGTVQGQLSLGTGAGGGVIQAAGTGNTLFNLGGSASILNFRTSSGTTMLQLQTTNNVVAVQNSLALPATKTWSGTSLSANAALFENSTWTGSSGTNATVVLHQIQATESIDAGSNGEVDGLQVQVNTNGAGWNGGRHAGQFIQNITTQPPATGGAYTALNTKVNLTAPSGGTGLTPSTTGVAIFANNPVTHLGSTATFSSALVGEEIDTWAQADTMDKIGLMIVDITGAGIGARDSVVLSLNNQYTQGSGGGFEYGLEFGRHSGAFPLTAAGTMIMTSLSGIAANNAAATGINLLGTNFSKWAFITKGASIDSTGTMQIGAGVLSSISSGLSLDAAGALGTGTPTVVSGGNYYIGGDVVTDAYGGIYSVQTLSGTTGTVATLVVQRQPFVPSRGSLPTNPVTLKTWRVGQATCIYSGFCDQWADGLTVNVTWDTTPTTLTLNASGGPTIIAGTVKVGTAGMTANGAVATTMTSLGPTGSHTTVQEWLTVTNNSGVVRYVPAY